MLIRQYIARSLMGLKRFKYLATAAIFTAACAILPAQLVRANISSCSANVSPHTVNTNDQSTLQFTITNSGNTDDIRYISIQNYFTEQISIISASANNWDFSFSAASIISTSGSLGLGNSLTVSAQIQTGSDYVASGDWNVFAGNSPDGTGNIPCDGSLGTQVGSPPAPPPPPAPEPPPPPPPPAPVGPVISNIAASASSNSATITWNTNSAATSQIHYGFGAGYGNTTDLGSALQTNHNERLTGLLADTAYHYQVVSTDGSGHTTSSADNTFLTSPEPIVFSAPTPSQAKTKQSEEAPISTKVAIKDVPTEKIPPTISLTTDFSKPFKTTPAIVGSAADNDALAGIEYSMDGGKDWLPVDIDHGLGTKNATFSFTPLNLDDGNYPVVARAIDISGNIGASDTKTLVIDRLDPLVGGNVISLGPQVLQPNENGVITSLVGVDQKITASAVGGPISINLAATDTKNPKLQTKNFALTKSSDTGLWSGIISFGNSGVYSLIANAVDGAGNKTTRNLNTVYVAAPAQIVKNGGNQAVAADVTLYYLEPTSNTWTVWDAASYGQENPQKTNANGNFQLLLPPGTYYLKATASGYHDLISQIFKTDHPTPISGVLGMKASHSLKLGPLHIGWPNFSTERINLGVDSSKIPQNLRQNNLLGQSLPTFSLADTNGGSANSVDWLGKPTLITFGATWSPATTEELATLSKLQTNQDINIIPIAAQERAARVRVYTAIAGYKMNWLVDPDSTLGQPFNIQSLPTHYFVDRKGIVRKVLVGVLSESEILDNLAGL